MLKVAGVRGKSKVICLKMLAETLIAQSYVALDVSDMKDVTSDDITLVSGRNLPSKIREWQESNYKNEENKSKN